MQRDGRRNGVPDAWERTSEFDGFGFDASSVERLGIMPQAAIGKYTDPYFDADREERGIGPCAGIGSRRGRLPHEAIFFERTARSRSCALAADAIARALARLASVRKGRS